MIGCIGEQNVDMLDFDRTVCEHLSSGTELEYGIVEGSATIVLIKSGRGGTARGEEDKYVRMARRLSFAHGCSVICSPNPADCATHEVDRRVIERYVSQKELADFSLSLIGSSNGAYQNLFLAERMPKTKAILCINMPLMVNYHRTASLLEGLDRVEKTLVYGTRDPSCPYLRFLENRRLPACRFLRIDGADHCFTGQTEHFVSLSDYL